jgi:peptidoglycan/xylan/chitin deacetylase (PgdA/CDA1 family)
MMLEAGFRFVTLAALLDRLADKDGPSPSGARGLAAVTFDDGLRNNLTIAQPILAALGIPATVFVASDLIGSRSPWLGDGAEAEMLSADDLRALVADGWEMGAHTASHADLSQLSYEASIEEISRGVAVLERETGVHVTTLAYPFGSHSTSAMDAARAAGLRAALTTGGTGWEPYALTRAMISAGDPLWVFALKVADAYEPLISSRPARFLRMQSRAWRARLSTG